MDRRQVRPARSRSVGPGWLRRRYGLPAWGGKRRAVWACRLGLGWRSYAQVCRQGERGLGSVAWGRRRERHVGWSWIIRASRLGRPEAAMDGLVAWAGPGWGVKSGALRPVTAQAGPVARGAPEGIGSACQDGTNRPGSSGRAAGGPGSACRQAEDFGGHDLSARTGRGRRRTSAGRLSMSPRARMRSRPGTTVGCQPGHGRRWPVGTGSGRDRPCRGLSARRGVGSASARHVATGGHATAQLVGMARVTQAGHVRWGRVLIASGG